MRPQGQARRGLLGAQQRPVPRRVTGVQRYYGANDRGVGSAKDQPGGLSGMVLFRGNAGTRRPYGAAARTGLVDRHLVVMRSRFHTVGSGDRVTGIVSSLSA